MNLGLLGANVAAGAYYFIDPSLNAGVSMLGATTALSTVMGVTLTMAIGGKNIRRPSSLSELTPMIFKWG